MRVHLEYGLDGLDVDIPSERVQVIAPRFVPGLADPEAAFRAAVRRPIGGRPLADRVRARDRIAIAIPDTTRPLPTERLLRWTLGELAHVPERNVVVVVGTGSHRASTPEEIRAMVGADLAGRLRIVNHVAGDSATLARAGRTREGRTVRMNRDWVEADRRIVMGFIEPHFMAGFSGGYKGVFPALADIDSIVHYHRAAVIADPKSTWGVLDGNPTQAQIRDAGSLAPVDFLVNVTQNRARAITGFFCGDVLAAHAQGCAVAKDTAMVPVARAVPVVVTTNSGYPLDQNLYQAVKGMHAAMQIVADGGLIVAASRCADGFPDHGNFKRLLFEHPSPRALLDAILASDTPVVDQWEAQLLAIIALKARIGLKSALPPDDVRRAHLEPVEDIAARLGQELARIGADAPVTVLPEGPQTIPYLAV